MATTTVYQSRNTVVPNSASVTWTIGSTDYTLSDDGKGALTGDGSGRISYYDGSITLEPNPAPQPADGDYSATFDEPTNGIAERKTQTETPINDTLTFTMDSYPVGKGTLVIKAKMLQFPATIRYGTENDTTQKQTTEVIVRDDGNGNLLRYGSGSGGENVGSINYTTGAVSIDARASYTYTRVTPLTNGQQSVTKWNKFEQPEKTDEYDLTYDLDIEYQDAGATTKTVTKTLANTGLKISLLPGVWRPLVPGSILFSYAGKTYRDRDGAILTDWSSTTDAGNSVGSIDYKSGEVLLSDYPAGIDATGHATLIACLTTYGERLSYYSKFRTAGAPLRQGSVVISAATQEGTTVSVQAENDGTFTDAAITSGTVDIETGTVSIEWATPVFPSTVKYSAVAYTYLPLDPTLIGLDPTRLPSDGRVPIFLPGDVGVFSHTASTDVASPVAGETLTLSRDHQAEVWVKGANGLTLAPAQYTLDREAGKVTWADPLTLQDKDETAVTTPLTVYDRVEDMVLITDVQVSGAVSFNAPLSQDYPAGEAILSSAALHGDLRARVYNLFHQSSWTSEWSDELIGNDTTAKYNNVAYPIEITNQGSIKERWLIRFTSSSSFEVVGETVGVIGTGSTSSDTAIANPASGAPYFTIRSDGWGSGWNAGNAVRFNTDGAQAPFWVARTILSGPATEEEDSFATQNRGDAD